MKLRSQSQPASLVTLPNELLNKIAPNLPPISLRDLSNTCWTMHEVLWVHGNRVWYDAMPPALYIEKWEYQRQPPTKLGRKRSRSEAESNIVPHGERMMLGGPYDAAMDYKREIIRRILNGDRCFVCLQKKDSRGSTHKIDLWDWKWCQECLEEYSIYRSAIRKLSQGIFDMIEFNYNQTPSKPTEVYYIPAVNYILSRYFCGLSLAILQWNYETHIQKTFDRVCSPIEERRWRIRQALTGVAEQLWEGSNVCSIVVRNCHGVITACLPHPNIPKSETWRNFRETFAPTEILRGFLFPDRTIANGVTAEYTRMECWLRDPTSDLCTRAQFARAETPEWMLAEALDMLYHLTDVLHDEYNLPGFGGSVRAWTDAADAWHVKRLERELTSGMTIRVDALHPSIRERNMHRGLVAIRKGLGLVGDPLSVNSDSNIVVPITLASPLISHGNALPLHVLDFRAHPVRELTQEEKKALNYFNKLVRHGSKHCPLSSYLFYPPGLKGLVRHMREIHPEHYWKHDFHSLG